MPGADKWVLLPGSIKLLYMKSTQEKQLPTIITYVSTFLNKEMLHVYRQVCGIDQFKNLVITRTRKNTELFPYNNLLELKKSPLRIFQRLFYQLLKKRIPVSRYEIRQIVKNVTDSNAKLIHIYLGTEAARLISYLRSESRPVIVSFHGADLSNSLSTHEFDQLLQYSSLFLARSESLIQALIERGCPIEKIRLNPTGVPVPDTYPERNIDTATTPIRLLQACRFNKKKGLDVTLCAVAKLIQSGMDVQLDLAGSGDLEASLIQMTEELGIKEKVNFLGFMNNVDLLHIMPDYHLFIHPSRTTTDGDREGIPNSILEAMACGLPVIATQHSGIPEAIDDGVEGILIPHADCDELTSAIKRAIDSNERYQSLSYNAWKKVKEHYSVNNNTRVLQAIYNELCD